MRIRTGTLWWRIRIVFYRLSSKKRNRPTNLWKKRNRAVPVYLSRKILKKERSLSSTKASMPMARHKKSGRKTYSNEASESHSESIWLEAQIYIPLPWWVICHIVCLMQESLNNQSRLNQIRLLVHQKHLTHKMMIPSSRRSLTSPKVQVRRRLTILRFQKTHLNVTEDTSTNSGPKKLNKERIYWNRIRMTKTWRLIIIVRSWMRTTLKLTNHVVAIRASQTPHQIMTSKLLIQCRIMNFSCLTLWWKDLNL